MKCGNEISDRARFCPSCGGEVESLNTNSRALGEEGYKLNLEKENTSTEYNNQSFDYQTGTYNNINYKDDNGSDMIGENKVSTLKAMVKDNVNLYINAFREIEEGGSGGATGLGIVAPIWFLYRRMYKYFFILLAVNIVTILLPGLGSLIGIGVIVYLCLNLRKLYYKSIVSKLEKNGLTGKDVEDDRNHLMIVRRIGQTSYTGIIVYVVVILMIGIIIPAIVTLTERADSFTRDSGYSSVKLDDSKDEEESEEPYEYKTLEEELEQHLQVELEDELEEELEKHVDVVEKFYKNSCTEVTYDELEQSPDVYDGLPLVITGQVVQILENEDNTIYRLAMTEYNDEWFDPIILEYDLTSQLEYQTDFWVLKGDIVTVWGDCRGLVEYESVSGEQIIVPGVNVMYMDLVEEAQYIY